MCFGNFFNEDNFLWVLVIIIVLLGCNNCCNDHSRHSDRSSCGCGCN